MTDPIKELSNLEHVVLGPLLIATGMSDDEQVIVKKQLLLVIVAQSIQKVEQALSEEEKESLLNELSQLDPQSQLDHLASFISQNEISQQLLSEYYQKDLPQLLKRLLLKFMNSATDEQKQRFLKASEAV